MNYTPLPPRENQSLPEAWPEGIYDFKILDATEGFTKASKPKLVLKVELNDGEKTKITYDHVVLDGKKLRNFSEMTGLGDKYYAGSLEDSDCMYVKGKLKLVINKSDEYGEQNNVAFYVEPKKTPEPPAIDEQDVPNDEIPW